MRRREFITLFGGAGALWPRRASAQQPAMPVIGLLRSSSQAASTDLVVAFNLGLKETGYVEGQNVTIEYRWAEGQNDRLPALAAELVGRRVAVITAAGSEALVAIKAATATIPIVFATGDDPVRGGFVASLGRPGGNITGVTFISVDLLGKQLQLLRELNPRIATIGFLTNPNSPGSEAEIQDVQSAARVLGLQLVVLRTSRATDFDAAFENLVQQRVGGLLVAGGAFFVSRRDQLAALAARHAIPSIYAHREYVTAGGLMSYGTSFTNAYRQVGNLVGRILKGAKPADLAVEQPTKFELVLNAKTAKSLGLDIPSTLLARVDEVIE